MMAHSVTQCWHRLISNAAWRAGAGGCGEPPASSCSCCCYWGSGRRGRGECVRRGGRGGGGGEEGMEMRRWRRG